MKLRFASLSLLTLCVTLAAVPAAAQDIYNNGPINGNVDAWTINFGYIVGDTFTVSSGTSTITGMSFGAWLFPGDSLTSAEVWISSSALGTGTTYFNQTVDFTASGCAMNLYGYNVCTETGLFSGPTLNNGTYWVNLENAVIPSGDPVYWDENSGVGCTSPGCPSQSIESAGSIPSESFTILGTASSTTTSTTTTGTVPEPSSLMLFASGFFGLAGMLRRKLF
ncbi:MAG: PEP-CTERM sorting domain-containing protein [Candidatus Korobacteraceae bacterium]